MNVQRGVTSRTLVVGGILCCGYFRKATSQAAVASGCPGRAFHPAGQGTNGQGAAVAITGSRGTHVVLLQVSPGRLPDEDSAERKAGFVFVFEVVNMPLSVEKRLS